MKTITKLLTAAATAAALTMTAAAAQATTFIRVVTAAGTVDSGPLADGAFAFNLTGNGTAAQLGGFNSISITGNSPNQDSGLLHSESVDINSSGAAFGTIYVTRTGLTLPAHRITSGFTYGSVGGNFTVASSTSYDTGNGLYGGVGLASTSFTGTASQAYNETDVFYPALGGTYSVTEKFIVTATGGTSVQHAATLYGAVPEAGTWALMIMGFGGAGAMLRRRKTLAVA